MTKSGFSILISTKNRCKDLALTLHNLMGITDENTRVIVYDDGSDDNTSAYVRLHFPQVMLLRNEISKGYLFCRNKMLNNVSTEFAISLDDDAHFLTDYPLEKIENYFAANANCGLVAMRIFWGLSTPSSTVSDEHAIRVKSFVGCAHAWRMESWRNIPDYPEWFVFYGEEDYASYQLFKKNIEIHYLPEVLVQHRVDVIARKNQKDYTQRLRRSLRSGWYLFFLFYPISVLPRMFAYSIWAQVKSKVLKGDIKALKSIFLAGIDLLLAIPKIISKKNRLTKKEFLAYKKLPETKIYWKPKTQY